jgi:Rps23 Pro-64 3,4-dihydroxylase Tpa1-like proline 4-hydroxylase
VTAKQILDSFSQTLIQDERILSPQERQLLISLLHNAKAPGSNPEVQSAVASTIARSVGETVAQRAFTLLGGSIVEQILAIGNSMTSSHNVVPVFATEKTPKPPGPPQPPRPAPEKDLPVSPKPQKPPGERPAEDLPSPMPPGSGMTQDAVQGKVNPRTNIAISDMPGVERARWVVLDEFLAPQELEELIYYVLQHEAEFQNSEVISPNGNRGVIDYEHRRSRVLMDLGKHREVILKRIQCVLPRVLDRLGIEEFPVARTEAQITASNDGDFFSPHTDDGQEAISSRRITFVYLFHREPRQFAGGELRLHDSLGNSKIGSYESIVPLQNQIVFFPCSVLHEITQVGCPSRAFVDSRFTLNGWLHGGKVLRDLRG